LRRSVGQRPGTARFSSGSALPGWTLAQLIEAGQLTPVVGKPSPLRQAPDAMRDLLAGHARGKLVITMTGAG
jgi:NADPH:quinone reductase-like Zn-dependent oxidoreductase